MTLKVLTQLEAEKTDAALRTAVDGRRSWWKKLLNILIINPISNIIIISLLLLISML